MAENKKKKSKIFYFLCSYVVQPGDDLTPGLRVGLDEAVEVDVVPLPDVRGHQVRAQPDGHDRRIWQRKIKIKYIDIVVFSQQITNPDQDMKNIF